MIISRSCSSVNGFEAKVTVSSAGLSAVPQPCQRSASGVAGAPVVSHWQLAGCDPRERPHDTHHWVALARPVSLPFGSYPSPDADRLRGVPRSAPAALSMALDTSSDFGKPLFPVGNATPLRTATNAPVGTRRHHTLPV